MEVQKVLALAALVVLVDCKSKPPPPPDPTVMGDLAAADGVDFTPYLKMAEAIALRKDRPQIPPPPARPGQRAFVTLWAPASDPTVGTGKGADLWGSVIAAAEDVAKHTLPEPRVEIDVVTSAEPVSLEGGAREETSKLGLRGYLVVSGADHVGFIPPSEVFVQKYFDMSGEKDGTVPLATDRLQATLSTRSGIDRKQLQSTTIYAVTTTSRLLSATGGALPLYRGWPDKKREHMGPGELMEATRAGADYLARIVDVRGHYQYRMKVVEASSDRSYGWLRHAGTTYALLEAFGELGNPQWLEKARLALKAIRAKMRLVPDVGAYLRDNNDEEQQKVGGNGLAILAFAKFAELTHEHEFDRELKFLADLIVKQQYADGHFRNNADVMHEDPSQKDLKTEVMYYPGEGMLGLVRAYALDPQPKYLETAKKAAAWMIDIRDQGKDDDHMLHDHWGCYALNDLYRVTKDPKYAEHAYKIARGILKGETTAAKAKWPDFATTFYSHGESTPTSTRLEAVAAVMELSRAAGKDTAWLDEAAQRYAQFSHAQQYDADSVYFTRDPKMFLGGVRESLMSHDIQIDFVQHAMSGWIHLAKLMRDPKWGTISPPAPAPESSARP